MTEVITKTHCRAIAPALEVQPRRLPPEFEVLRIEVECMSPEMSVGERIWIDRRAVPQTGDVVIARDTEDGRIFMGVYSDGYGGGFFVRPRRGALADSTIHPVAIEAVVMAHLKEMRRPA